MITEFADNDHLSGLESLILQQNNSAADASFKVIVNLQSDMLREKVRETLQLCEVDFSFPDNKKWFSCQEIENKLQPLLKERFEYKMKESELELALGALNAGIMHLSLASLPATAQNQFSLKTYTLN